MRRLKAQPMARPKAQPLCHVSFVSEPSIPLRGPAGEA